MRVLLLYPPRYRGQWSTREYKDGYFNEPHNPYLGPSIVGVLRRHLPELDLRVLDAQLDDLAFPDIAPRVRDIAPDLILCLLNFAGLDEDRRCLELPYPTVGVMQGYVDQQEAVRLYDLRAEYFTKAEIEYTVLEAVTEFLRSGRIEKTPGLLIRRDGTLHDTGSQPFQDLADYPFPAFDLFDIDRYVEHQLREAGTGYIYLYTTRGCPYNCFFCSAGNSVYRTVRKKSPAQVVEEIRYFMTRGFRHFYFYDDVFAIDMKRAKTICREVIASGLRPTLACYNTVNNVDEELLDLMQQAGFYLVRYGVETGDETLQQALDSEVSDADVIRAFTLTRKRGILVDAFLLVGAPGETRASLDRTYRLMKRAKPDRIVTSILFPKPYSRLYHDLKDRGQLLEPDWTRHVGATRLTFVHDTYRSMDEIAVAEEWLRNRVKRYIAFREIFVNRTRRKLMSRVLLFFYTFSTLRAFVQRSPAARQFLSRRLERPSLLRV